MQGPSGGWATEQDMCSHRTEHWLDWRLVQLGPLARSLSSSFHLTNKKQKNSLHEGLCIDLWTAFCKTITSGLIVDLSGIIQIPMSEIVWPSKSHLCVQGDLGQSLEPIPSPSSEYSFRGKAVHVNSSRSGNCLLYQQNLLPMNHSDSTHGC